MRSLSAVDIMTLLVSFVYLFIYLPVLAAPNMFPSNQTPTQTQRVTQLSRTTGLPSRPAAAQPVGVSTQRRWIVA